MKIKELTIEMATLEQMLTQKNAELTEYFGEVADKDREAQELRRQIDDLTTRLEDREAEIGRQTAVMAASQDHQNLVELRAQLEQQSAIIQTLEAEREVETLALQAELAAAREERDAALFGQAAHENEKEALNTRLEAAEKAGRAAAERADQLLAQVQELQEASHSKESELKALLSDEQKKATEALAAAERNLADQEKKMVVLEEELAERERKMAAQAATLDSLRAELEKSNLEAAEEKNRLTLASSDLVSQVEKLKSELVSCQEEISGLKAEMELKEGDVAALNEDMLAKYQIIEDLQKELDQLREESSSQLEQMRVESSSKLAQLQQQLDSTQEETARLQQLLDSQREEGRSHTEELQQLLDRQKEEGKSQTDQLHEELEESSRKMLEMEEREKEMQAALTLEQGASCALRKELASKVSFVNRFNNISGNFSEFQSSDDQNLIESCDYPRTSDTRQQAQNSITFFSF
jgi:chromosome segregation ATPase